MDGCTIDSHSIIVKHGDDSLLSKTNFSDVCHFFSRQVCTSEPQHYLRKCILRLRLWSDYEDLYSQTDHLYYVDRLGI